MADPNLLIKDFNQYDDSEKIVPIFEDNSFSDVWNKTTKVEENNYYWKGTPIINKGEVIQSNKPKVVELFSGCGGTSLGFEMANYSIMLGLDIHKPSIETFKYNHPGATTILGDIRKIEPSIILDLIGNKEIDVLIGGVPCQGFSLNNRKRHEADERNYLYKEFIRFMNVLKPKAVLLENVSGMVSTGNFVHMIENDISKYGDMSVASSLLYAPDYGVPQKRTRLVFVGLRSGEKFDFSTIVKTHGPTTNKPYTTIWEAIGDLPSLQSNESSSTYSNVPMSEYQKLMRQTGMKNVINHKAPNHPKDVIEKIANTKQGFPIYSKYKQRIRLAWNSLSPTQVSGGIRPQFQFGHPKDNRGLTIRERCRLQSFPDNFMVCGGIVQGRVQTGNAVPPLLAKAIGEALKRYL